MAYLKQRVVEASYLLRHITSARKILCYLGTLNGYWDPISTGNLAALDKWYHTLSTQVSRAKGLFGKKLLKTPLPTTSRVMRLMEKVNRAATDSDTNSPADAAASRAAALAHRWDVWCMPSLPLLSSILYACFLTSHVVSFA